jgi:peptide subunit release factor 1 (eRF1)
VVPTVDQEGGLISVDRIRTLASLEGSPVVTSCYLDVDGRTHRHASDYEAELDHLLRVARERVHANGNDRDAVRSVESDLDQMSSWVRGGFDRSRVRGLAMFACSARGWFEVVELPRPVRSQIVLNAMPHLRQLEYVVGEFDAFAIVLVDRSHSRIFRFEMGELTEHDRVDDAVPRRHDQGGWSAPNIQRHADEVAHRHLKHTAEVLFDEVQARAVDHLVLGGPHEVVAEFESVLHPYQRERVVATVSLSVHAGTEEVRQAALEVEERVERARATERVDRLRDAVGAGNGGVAGLEATLAALVARRVDILLVSDGFEAQGWRCRECRHLATRGRSCPVCERQMELVDDVVAEAIDDAIGMKCTVDVVRENADLDVLGRIGALLRF